MAWRSVISLPTRKKWMSPLRSAFAGVPIAPDNLPDDPAALKRIIAAMAQDALTAQAEIAESSPWTPAGYRARQRPEKTGKWRRKPAVRGNHMARPRGVSPWRDS
jgi:hypothetical protein